MAPDTGATNIVVNEASQYIASLERPFDETVPEGACAGHLPLVRQQSLQSRALALALRMLLPIYQKTQNGGFAVKLGGAPVVTATSVTGAVALLIVYIIGAKLGVLPLMPGVGP